MALPRTTPSSWMSGIDFPTRLFETGSDDFELYEEDDEFVLAVELPGFDPEEITASWDDGMLNVAARREDDARGERRTYHRRFRFPKEVDDDAIYAEYVNGVLEVHLPIDTNGMVTGREIPIEA
ncbi:Hsp20/alpha crystallin family protein [Halorubrum vacuolatum]|uniref:HSP20 family protein n=1 Tax=Halorubrum vacuolatum TaxID=63740 RepID=A0A238X5A6_HALVU|nr:Hsp20/alpha crystallin family protein [Halorubrum vacuolatum]SNR53743.1 HSP20 family protein [Halorubrum vacuolatum]